MFRSTFAWSLILVGVGLTASVRGQTTWYVDDDNCPGLGSGTEADPFCSIQTGIDAASTSSGDECLVAPGTYYENLNMMGKAITLRSQGGASQTTIDAANEVTATFDLNQYPLTVSTAGTGSGTITSDPAGIDCAAGGGGDCSEPFKYNTVVTLTASAGTGSTFDGWSGACTIASGDCVVTMDAAKAVTATFELIVDTEYRIYLPFIARQSP